MRIPRYWANEQQSATAADGRSYWLSCWRWSQASQEEAKQSAKARAQELLWKLQSGGALDRYSYGDRPVREEIKQSITTADGREVGIITRNPYGALVLNTASAMFIDIDFEKNVPPQDREVPSLSMQDLTDVANSLVSGLKSLFGSGSPPPQPAPRLAVPPPSSPVDRHIQRIEAFASRQPDLDFRIYRTFAGLRCLITNYTFEPTSAASTELLNSLGSDPLYIKLCRTQECFRARLTAKPWRCGSDRPPFRYPWTDARAESIYRQWEQRYTSVASQYAACKLVKQIGGGRIHPDVEPVLAAHDALSSSQFDLSLA